MINKQEINDKCKKYYLKRMNEKCIDKGVEALVTLGTFSTALESPILLGGAALSGIATITELVSLKKECMQYCSYLKHSDNIRDNYYLSLKEKYDIYIDKVARYIENKNITDPLDIGFYFCRLLYSGNLSLNNGFEYCEIKDDEDSCYQGILGARIISGYGVCRNIASILTDVYKKMGIDATYLVVKNKKIDKETHAVCLIKDNNGAFIFDPTWRTIGIIDDNMKVSKEIISFCEDKVHSGKYRIIGFNDDNYCYHSITKDMFKDIIKAKSLTKEYICERYKLFSTRYFPARFYDETAEFKQEYEPSFYENNKELMQEISEMEQSLTLPKIKKKTRY